MKKKIVHVFLWILGVVLGISLGLAMSNSGQVFRLIDKGDISAATALYDKGVAGHWGQELRFPKELTRYLERVDDEYVRGKLPANKALSRIDGVAALNYEKADELANLYCNSMLSYKTLKDAADKKDYVAMAESFAAFGEDLPDYSAAKRLFKKHENDYKKLLKNRLSELNEGVSSAKLEKTFLLLAVARQLLPEAQVDKIIIESGINCRSDCKLSVREKSFYCLCQYV